MKTFNRLCWLALVAAAPVQAQPTAADFCMFQVGHGSRIERGASVPVPDLLEQMLVRRILLGCGTRPGQEQD